MHRLKVNWIPGGFVDWLRLDIYSHFILECRIQYYYEADAFGVVV